MSVDPTRKGVHHTPLGPVVVTAGDAGVSGLRFTEAELPERALPASMAAIGEQLDAYFAGELRQFDLAVDVAGSPLELAVWKALRDIPFGATVSYGELTAGLDPALFDGRAEPWQCPRIVGAALGRNPTPLLVPCHRVIGADGSLTGYAGGVWRKRALLDLERGALGPEPVGVDHGRDQQLCLV